MYTEERNGNPFQYSGLKNSMDCIVYGGVSKSRTEQLNNSNISTYSSW